MQAFGGNNGSAPFSQAVLQSPGFEPIVGNVGPEGTLRDYLVLLNVSTIEEARQLPYSALQMANIEAVGSAPYGSFIYGPAVDGDFVPQLPGQLLLQGQFDKSIRVMLGHNADEGLLFTSPYVQNNSAFAADIVGALPTLHGDPATVEYITNTLYPPVFDGSQAQNYTDQIGRAAALTSELVFTCNTFYLDKAFNNNTYSYYFTVPPALHGFDIPYTYYNGNGSASSSVAVPAIAIAMQEYITHFAETGNANEAGVPFFPIYGNNATVQVLAATGISQAADPAANHRCDWWQKALYY